jgi:hypothetical protein
MDANLLLWIGQILLALAFLVDGYIESCLRCIACPACGTAPYNGYV